MIARSQSTTRSAGGSADESTLYDHRWRQRERRRDYIGRQLRSEKDLGSIALQEFMDKLQEVNMRSATSIFE